MIPAVRGTRRGRACGACLIYWHRDVGVAGGSRKSDPDKDRGY